jgi:hypothetical protein
MNGSDFYCSVIYKDENSEIVCSFKNPFYTNFMEGTLCREICYECSFAKKERIGDITLEGFCNIEDINLYFGIREHASLVLVNTKKEE